MTVNGVTVTVDATALTTPSLLSDYRASESTAASFTLTLLPGVHNLEDPEGTGTFDYTVNNDGTISYDAALEGILSGQGTNQLTVNGAS